MRAYLDANFFIFSLLDKTEIGDSAREIQKRLAQGEFKGFTSSLALDEVLWVLIKNKKEGLIQGVMDDIYRTPNLLIVPVSSTAPILAAENIGEYGLNPRDATHVAVMEENGIEIIVSDDRDFEKVDKIEWHDFKEFLEKKL